MFLFLIVNWAVFCLPGDSSCLCVIGASHLEANVSEYGPIVTMDLPLQLGYKCQCIVYLQCTTTKISHLCSLRKSPRTNMMQLITPSWGPTVQLEHNYYCEQTVLLYLALPQMQPRPNEWRVFLADVLCRLFHRHAGTFQHYAPPCSLQIVARSPHTMHKQWHSAQRVSLPFCGRHYLIQSLSILSSFSAAHAPKAWHENKASL